MAKSKVIAVSVHIDPHSNGRTEATFYRYEKGHHPAYDDWMQMHRSLTVASCRRLCRIVDGGSVTIGSNRLSIFQEIDEAFWSFEKKNQRDTAYWEARAYELEDQLASSNKKPIAAQLAALIREIYTQYQAIGHHTFTYWLTHGPGESFLAAALTDFVEERYPIEWAAAWQPYADDATVRPRDPRPAEESYP